ncbi:MAG: hypothetical protein B2I17_03400 [Thermoplasmatales archaeon B_DKE]|nr:MAG: hypothetical protein B2I17_03400 [Thermoplasmatales archaeon B_DKE]
MVKRVTYIIGAGASHGYDNRLVDSQKPPTGNRLLSMAAEKGILIQEKYPHLYPALKYYCTENRKDSEKFSDVDIEEFLDSLATYLESVNKEISAGFPTPTSEETEKVISAMRTDFLGFWEIVNRQHETIEDPFEKLRKVAYNFQCALGESWYMMFELFRDFSASYRPTCDAYQRLALHHMRNHYDVISLNYDLIFELAAESVGLWVQYPWTSPVVSTLTSDRIITMAKVHGSINWLNKVSRAISVGDRGDSSYKLLDRISGLIYSNRFNVEHLKFVNPSIIGNIGMDNLLQSGTEYYEPALLPPVGNYKDYDKVTYFVENWKVAERMISQADELIFIGTQVRPHDKKLRETLKANSKKRIDVVVVGSKPSDDELANIFGSNLGQISRHKDFETFAQTL